MNTQEHTETQRNTQKHTGIQNTNNNIIKKL